MFTRIRHTLKYISLTSILCTYMIACGNATYTLIYVDDDIPELVIDTGVEAGGCQILTFYDGEIDLLQTARLNFYYIEGWYAGAF